LGISDPESDKDQFIWYGHWNPIILKDDSCRVINNKENRLEYIISKDTGIKANLQTTYLTKDCRYYNMPRETLQSITEYFQVAKVEMEAKNLQAEAIIFNIESNNKVSIADYIAGSNSSKQNVRRVALQMHSSNEEKRLASAAVEARDRNLK
jgi:purine-nucleoside phosphorylase